MKLALREAHDADAKEAGRRMRAMRKTVLEKDVRRWAQHFLTELADTRPDHDKVVHPARRI
jgi:trehalose 6-phosphate synthase